MTAVQTVLNDSDIPLWQVPRDAYRQVIASMADLELNLTSSGPLGARPYGELESANQELNALGVPTGETFVLGDSPLVLLTALLTAFEPDPASSASVQVPAPVVGDDGNYVPGDNSRQPNRRRKDIRVFTSLDSALLLRDLYAKVRRHGKLSGQVRRYAEEPVHGGEGVTVGAEPIDQRSHRRHRSVPVAAVCLLSVVEDQDRSRPGDPRRIVGHPGRRRLQHLERMSERARHRLQAVLPDAASTHGQ